MLLSCINQNQNAFVSGRMLHDNALIAHELLHYLQSSQNDPNKWFVTKLDMSKAYDRIEWNFLEVVLVKMGFPLRWILKVMNNVRLIRYVVKYNAFLTKEFCPGRGLRQGDPLSSYLFLFCIEAFLCMLLHSQREGLIRGIRAS